MTIPQQTNQDFIDEGLLLCIMKGKLLGFPIIVVLLLGAVFSFSNDKKHDILHQYEQRNNLQSAKSYEKPKVL